MLCADQARRLIVVMVLDQQMATNPRSEPVQSTGDERTGKRTQQKLRRPELTGILSVLTRRFPLIENRDQVGKHPMVVIRVEWFTRTVLSHVARRLEAIEVVRSRTPVRSVVNRAGLLLGWKRLTAWQKSGLLPPVFPLIRCRTTNQERSRCKPRRADKAIARAGPVGQDCCLRQRTA